MTAVMLTIRLDTKWILNNVTPEKLTLIDDVIRTLKKDEMNNHLTVINKDVQQCRAMLISKETPDKVQIDKMLRDELKIIDDSVTVDINIENVTKEHVRELVHSGKSLSEEDSEILENELGITIDKPAEQQSESPDEKNDKKEAEPEKKKRADNKFDTDSLIGIEPVKKWIEDIKALSSRYHELVNDKGIIWNTAYLISVNRGNGLSTILKIMAQTLNEEKLADINIGKHIEEFKLICSDESFAESYREIKKVIDYSKQYRTDCIISISLEEWMDKIYDSRIGMLLKYIWENRGHAIFVFTVPYAETAVIGQIHNRIDDIINVRTIKIVPPSDEEYFEYFKIVMKGYGLAVEDDAEEVFLTKITSEKNDGKFYGYNTVQKIADEFLMNMLIDTAKNGIEKTGVVTANEMSKYCSVAISDSASGTRQLEEMIALDEVKQKVREIILTVKLQKELYMSGGSSIKPCFHMMFSGNPGTGKTVVARIIGKIFKEEGLLSVGNFFEVSRKDLVGRYVGQTAPKTMEVCRNAYGSVLFVDEAYLLANDRDGYSSEAIGTLIAEMENNRDNMVVIFAGYEKELKALFDMNPGLRDRIPHKLSFPNYSRAELEQIFFKQLKDKIGYNDAFVQAADKFFAELSDDVLGSSDFSNGRFVRNLAERIISKAALRFDMTDEGVDRFELTENDFEIASGDKDFQSLMKRKEQRRIGFN